MRPRFNTAILGDSRPLRISREEFTRKPNYAGNPSVGSFLSAFPAKPSLKCDQTKIHIQQFGSGLCAG
jgi:hypothetical protein